MSRIFGFVIGAIWLLFSLNAFRASAAGWAEGHSDLGFWYGVIGVLLLIGCGTAIVGTLRYRYEGPKKTSPG